MTSCATQALELLLLQDAKQFGLQRRRNITDLVQKERAFVSQLEAANLLRDGSGERPFFAASRAELLPITCSNLRSSRSWLREFNPWKAATENLLAIRMLATVRGSTLQCRAYILEQDFIVERFCHEFHCACSQSLHPHF